MSNELSICYDSSISTIRTLTNADLIYNRSSWTTFNRIQSYNSNVSTLRHDGANLLYYTYTDFSERNKFTKGQFLHFTVYPELSNFWNPVNKD
jgi:hypothetical protein